MLNMNNLFQFAQTDQICIMNALKYVVGKPLAFLPANSGNEVCTNLSSSHAGFVKLSSSPFGQLISCQGNKTCRSRSIE